MSRKTLDLSHFVNPDNLGCEIAAKFQRWEMARAEKVAEWQEIQRYIFATDTTKTTNAKLDWSNKTTIPKLCQIRDNLVANYVLSLFPKRKWLKWEGDTAEDDSRDKKQVIEAYMNWVIDRSEFYDEITKLVTDYVDYGNPIGTVKWVDNTVETEDKQQLGFVGPQVVRVSPLDIVFDPTAQNFIGTPKIVRSLVTLGEIKDMVEQMTGDESELADARELYEYMKSVRQAAQEYQGTIAEKDALYEVAGFDSFREYLGSNYCEVLTFYGDLYDPERDELLKNYVIKVVDRHKVFSKKPNVSYFGHYPMYHAGWRVRPDNLLAMGPLDNLVGMQYRIDHLENLKSDLFDLTAFPPLKVRGYVEDFEWGPFEKIYIGDNEGDVEIMSPNVQAMAADTQIAILEQKMEEMAGSPKEAMGFRSPGEKTAYEVQRLENAASRIFQAKIIQFERDLLEPLLNAMLELARRNLTDQTIRVFDSEYKVNRFLDLTAQDITGNGRIRPLAARNFAEKAQQIQNLSTFFQSFPDQEVRMHFSSVKLAKLFENLLDLEEYDVVEPYIRLSEQAEAQAMAMAQQEETQMAMGTPSGLSPDDYDPDIVNQMLGEAPVEQDQASGEQAA